MTQARIHIPTLFFILAAVVLSGASLFTYLRMNGLGIDLMFHDTYSVVGINVFLLMLGFFLAACGLAYFLYPSIFHKSMNRLLAYLHFWISVFFVLVLFAADANAHGIRATDAATFEHAIQPIFILGFVGLFGFFFAQLLFVANMIWSLFRGAPSRQTRD